MAGTGSVGGKTAVGLNDTRRVITLLIWIRVCVRSSMQMCNLANMSLLGNYEACMCLLKWLTRNM